MSFLLIDTQEKNVEIPMKITATIAALIQSLTVALVFIWKMIFPRLVYLVKSKSELGNATDINNAIKA